MKATAPPAKRRRGPRLAVLALVFCSLLVPIAFLFNRFPAGESSRAPARAPEGPRIWGMPEAAWFGSARIYCGECRSVCCSLALRIGDFVVTLFCFFLDFICASFLIGSIVFCDAVYVTDERPQPVIACFSLLKFTC
jgi:hypothetical protein